MIKSSNVRHQLLHYMWSCSCLECLRSRKRNHALILLQLPSWAWALRRNAHELLKQVKTAFDSLIEITRFNVQCFIFDITFAWLSFA